MIEHFFVHTPVVARLRGGPLGPYLDDLATTLHQKFDHSREIMSGGIRSEEFATSIRRGHVCPSPGPKPLLH
jgi:hypothetical protein